MTKDAQSQILASLRANVDDLSALRTELQAEIDAAAEKPDVVLAKVLDEAAARYRGILTPAGMKEARRLLVMLLLADPRARTLLDEERAKHPSGVVQKLPSDVVEAARRLRRGG